MARYKFSLVSITPSLIDQTITYEFSLDVDEDSINNSDILLVHEDKHIVPFDVEVDGNIVILHLKEWAVPNVRYLSMIRTEVLSITGESLDLSLLRYLEFSSDVTSTVEIHSPNNYELCNGPVTVTWSEINSKPEDKIHSFYLEVASDTGFYNIVYRTTFDKRKAQEDAYTMTLQELNQKGQFYLRMRAQDIKEPHQYGPWSPVITFTVQDIVVVPDTSTLPPAVESATAISSEGIRITDLTKEPLIDPRNPKPEPLSTYKQYEEELPEHFELSFPFPIDITNASVTGYRTPF